MAEKGELKKLTIEPYTKLDYSEKAGVGDFVAMFNPSSYKQKYEIEYQAAQGQGSTGSTQKFGKIKPQEYSFEFLFDGTGVSSEKKEVADEIEHFLVVCGKNNGDIHRPHYLKISWGSLISKCVLKSADISYNLFRPDGKPLRAKVSATFAENIDDTLRVAEEGNNSPDLTHMRIVQQGDTLPLMTYRIYGKPDYYLQIAKANNLVNFRRLQVGQAIYFPPLTEKGAQ
jgi:nucleoid-associated protein YgaU